MLLIFVKDHCLLKNNLSLISVNTASFVKVRNFRQLDINHQKLVSSSAGGCCTFRRVQLTLVPLPWPRRGTSSSLQGVWQACSPINCLCSSLVWTKRHHHPLHHCTAPLPVSFTNRETFLQFL